MPRFYRICCVLVPKGAEKLLNDDILTKNMIWAVRN